MYVHQGAVNRGMSVSWMAPSFPTCGVHIMRSLRTSPSSQPLYKIIQAPRRLVRLRAILGISLILVGALGCLVNPGLAQQAVSSAMLSGRAEDTNGAAVAGAT